MLRFLSAFSLLLTMFLHASQLAANLESTLNDKLSESRFKTVSGSIVVEALYSDGYERLFEENANQLFTPASTIKPILSLAVLHQFGVNYRFNTKLYTDAKFKEDVLSGNIYLKGFGDPSLTFLDILNMVRQLKKRGIKQIDGDLIYDDTFYNVDYKLNARAARYYSAPPGALSVNSNAVQFQIDQATQLLQPVINSNYVTYYLDGLVLDSSEKPGYPWPEINQLATTDHYIFHGNVTPKDIESHFLEVLVSRPGMYFASLFRQALLLENIRFSGNIRPGLVDKDHYLLINYEGQKLKTIIKRLNTESNNVIASMLNLNLAMAKGGIPANKEAGLKYLTHFAIKELQFEEGSFYFNDASGLSIHNKITANEMMKLLRFIYSRKNYRQLLLDSFIKVGEGTEINQVSVPNYFNVYVKTGTLASRGVNSLIGFIIDTRTDRAYSFCFLLDDQEGDAPKGYFTYPILNQMILFFAQSSIST